MNAWTNDAYVLRRCLIGYLFDGTEEISEQSKANRIKVLLSQFLQLLDDWNEKVCKTKPKEVIIKCENDQFIIETKD